MSKVVIIRGWPTSVSWSGGDAEVVRSRMQQDSGKVRVLIPREWGISVSWSRSDAETDYFLVQNVSMVCKGLNESRMADSRVSEWKRGRGRLLQRHVSNHMCRISSRMGNCLYHFRMVEFWIVEWERRGGRSLPSAISLEVYRVGKSVDQ